jgi:hypothetical protein
MAVKLRGTAREKEYCRWGNYVSLIFIFVLQEFDSHDLLETTIINNHAVFQQRCNSY